MFTNCVFYYQNILKHSIFELHLYYIIVYVVVKSIYAQQIIVYARCPKESIPFRIFLLCPMSTKT